MIFIDKCAPKSFVLFSRRGQHCRSKAFKFLFLLFKRWQNSCVLQVAEGGRTAAAEPFSFVLCIKRRRKKSVVFFNGRGQQSQLYFRGRASCHGVFLMEKRGQGVKLNLTKLNPGSWGPCEQFLTAKAKNTRPASTESNYSHIHRIVTRP